MSAPFAWDLFAVVAMSVALVSLIVEAALAYYTDRYDKGEQRSSVKVFVNGPVADVREVPYE